MNLSEPDRSEQLTLAGPGEGSAVESRLVELPERFEVVLCGDEAVEVRIRSGLAKGKTVSLPAGSEIAQCFSSLAREAEIKRQEPERGTWFG